MDFSRLINVFNRTIDQWGVIGSILTGSMVSMDDYGDETPAWTVTLGSMYFKRLSDRELQFLPEGEREDGRSVVYVPRTNDFHAGSQYRIGYSGEDYEVLVVKRNAPAGSLIFTTLDLRRINSD
jgi:hypothetical protein